MICRLLKWLGIKPKPLTLGLHMVPIDEIKVTLGPSWPGRVDDKYFPMLVESIRSEGVQRPLFITPNRELVDGVRRLEAAKKVGIKELPVQVIEMTREAFQFSITHCGREKL